MASVVEAPAERVVVEKFRKDYKPVPHTVETMYASLSVTSNSDSKVLCILTG
jgi:uncharacterized membrane protein